MAYVALAVGGASVVSGIMGSNAAKDAASQQRQAAAEATAEQRRQYDQTRADQQPWRQAGESALGQMQDPSFQKTFGMSDFQADPGYAFRMQEGQKALERSAAARGGLNSGATMKALTRYGQDAGSQEYQNAYNRFNNDSSQRFNRLASLAGVGQTANGVVAQAGSNMANNVSQNMLGAGNAAAAGTVGSANAITGAIGNGMKSWMDYSMMNRMFPTGTGGGGASDPSSIASSGSYSPSAGFTGSQLGSQYGGGGSFGLGGDYTFGVKE